MRVLVADDDLTSRNILAAVLKKWGLDFVVTEDGLSAWDVLQRPDAPRLILLDWNMPGMDGLEVCRRLREKESHDPPYVILLTARGEKSDIVQGLEAGANDFVTKPFDPGELSARLAVGRRVIDLQSALNERIRELSAAIEHVKTLQGIIPICMHCHKIRTDTDSWQRIEQYIQEHSDAHFSHGICPRCLEQHHPET
jgi:DNA-binding response OmpR family regulator